MTLYLQNPQLLATPSVLALPQAAHRRRQRYVRLASRQAQCDVGCILRVWSYHGWACRVLLSKIVQSLSQSGELRRVVGRTLRPEEGRRGRVDHNGPIKACSLDRTAVCPATATINHYTSPAALTFA